jgi:hypothetical protein
MFNISLTNIVKVKVNTSLYTPSGFQDVEVQRISRVLVHASDKVVSPTHRPHLPPEKYSWYLFLLEP